MFSILKLSRNWSRAFTSLKKHNLATVNQIARNMEESEDASPTTVSAFVTKHIELINMEQDADLSERKKKFEDFSLSDFKSRGLLTLKVLFMEESKGMYGRHIITFRPLLHQTELSAHNFKKGDMIGFSCLTSTEECGIIRDIKKDSITLVVDKIAEELDNYKPYYLFHAGTTITYKRIKRALRSLGHGRHKRANDMINVMFGQARPTCLQSENLSLKFINSNLNEEQKAAVEFALRQNELAVIHGPPGTGKTTTVVEVILQMIGAGLKVLACAPSNVATDNLVEGLSKYTKKIARLGHPARTMSGCQVFNIDHLLSRSEYNRTIKDIEQSIQGISDKVVETTHMKRKKQLQHDKHLLVTEKKQYQKIMMNDILGKCDIVLATLTSASNDGPLSFIDPNYFDVAVIDECPQAIEAACWIPLLYAKKCILAGDHLQLPPVIISEHAEKAGLGVTIMERVLKIHGDEVKKLLTLQYRMHQNIMEWPSQLLYNGLLRAHESNAQHLLSDIPGIEKTEDTSLPLLLIDTAGCNMFDLELAEDESKGNYGEADIVRIHVQSLIKSGLDAANIAVITPYTLQVEILRARLCEEYPTLEISTVDGFQGREKEAVVITLVRSNTAGEIGFLREDRRINVAITRAKRHLAVVCDSETVSHHPFLKAFVEYLQEKGEVRSAAQYESEIDSLPLVEGSSRRQSMVGATIRKATKSGGVTKIVNQSEKKVVKDPTSSTRSKFPSNPSIMAHVITQREIFMKMIVEFIASEDEVLLFPKTLQNYERKIVHELAEEFQLLHRSEGDEEERRIIVLKPNSSEHNLTEIDKQLFGTDSLPQDLDEDAVTALGQYSVLRESICEETNKSCSDKTANDLKPSVVQKPNNKSALSSKVSKPATKSSNSLKASPLINADIDDDDFDALVAAAVKQDNMCMFKKCKRKDTSLLLNQCMHCKNRFCFEHLQYEVHGCGQAARSYERSQVRKLGVVLPGSGKRETKTNSTRHIQLQRLMDKKINDMATKRKHSNKKT